MSSLQQFLGERNKVWESLQTSSTEQVEVSEIWQSKVQIKPFWTVHRTIRQSDLSEWFRETRSGTTSQQDHACLLRAVWVTRLLKQRIDDVTSTAMTEITKAFDQELAQAYLASCYRGVGDLHQTERGTRSYFFCNHPKIALSWSREKDSVTTNLFCIAEDSKIQMMRESLDCGFVQVQAFNEMVVGLVCAIMLSIEIDTAQTIIKHKVREVEVRTGYHEWQSRVESAALGDLESLWAKMSGCGTKTAALIRKVEVLQELTSFISQDLTRIRDDYHLDSSRQQEFESHLETLRRRANMQQTDATFFAIRTKSQLTALFHIIAQNDVVLSHEIAKDSRLLALAAQQDSSSMKCLAVVTMFFLPGTFVSSLFSIPLFDWEDSNSGVWRNRAVWSPRLAAFATVTVPLMLLTFSVWGLWHFVQGLESRKRRQEAETRLKVGLKTTEVVKLGERRMSTLSM